MKNKIIFCSLFILAGLVFGQDFQVSQVAPYSVDVPVLTILNGYAHITMGTNMYYFKIPVGGPTAPLVQPPMIDSNAYAPDYVELGSYGNALSCAYVDYDRASRFVLKYSYSTDQGTKWYWPGMVVDTIETGGSYSLADDNPMVKISAKGIVYVLWNKYVDSSKLYLAKTTAGPGILMPKFRIDTWDAAGNREIHRSWDILTINGVDHIFLVYAVDKKLYFTHSADEGMTFSAPVNIATVNSIMWGYFNSTTITGLSTGKLFVGYTWMGEGQNFAMVGGTHILSSTNKGDGWATTVMLDSNGSSGLDLKLTSKEVLVATTRSARANFYVRSSKDGKNWSDTMRVNSVPGKITSGGFDTKGFRAALIDTGRIGYVYLDERTGGRELYYANVKIPVPPSGNAVAKASAVPEDFSLAQNYPNPFNPTTTIRFSLPVQQQATLVVHDMLGRVVAVLADGVLSAGVHAGQWNAAGVPSGMYFYTLRAGQASVTKSLLLLK